MLNIGNKTLRNLPEQVGFLTKEVSKIWEALDGLDVYDNVIILENLNPLTPAQIEIINKPVSFIVYNNTLYMKRGVGVSEVYFDAVFQVSESGGIVSFNSSEITITEPLGTLALTNTSTSSYSKDEEDSLLSAKLDISAVLDLIFPVNSVFISTANTSPAGLIGGTWNALNSGNKIYLPDKNKIDIYQDTGTVLGLVSSANNSKIINLINTSGTGANAVGPLNVVNYGSPALAEGRLAFPTKSSGLTSGAKGDISEGVEVYAWERIA